MRQTCIKIQAHLSLTRIQIDRSDRLISFLPGVDGHLGGRVERGGGPVDFAGQGAILNHLVAVDSQSSKQGEMYLLYFNPRRWSNLDKGFVKQGLRIALLTKHLQVEIENRSASESDVL